MATDGLSTSAARLLSVLRARAGEPLPDHKLAELTHLPHREIIDLADELLAAGLPVCAAGRGRWLGDAVDLQRYIDSLDKRGRKVFIRRQHAQRALARLSGQLNLFAGARP